MATEPWNDITAWMGGTYPQYLTTISEGWGERVQRNLDRLWRQPGVMVQRNTAQLLPDADGSLRVSWTDSDLWDTDGFHNPASEPDTIRIPAGLGGIYRFDIALHLSGVGGAAWNGGTGTGHAFIEAYVDDAVVGFRQSLPLPVSLSIPNLGLCMGGELALPDGSELKFRPFQNSGSDAEIAPEAGPASASLRWVSPI